MASGTAIRVVRQLAAVLMAAALCATVATASQDLSSLLKSADAFVAEHRFDRARKLYEQALARGAQFDSDPVHARNIGAAYLNSTPPDLQNAVRWLRVAVHGQPAENGARSLLAQAELRSGDVAAAVNDYRVLVHDHPQTSEYVLGLGSAFRQSGRPDAALQLFQTTLAEYPHLTPVRVEYARLLNFSRQFSEATSQFAAVLQREPDNVIAQVGMAKATSFQGDQQEAISMYDRILQRHPGLYDAIVGKAFSLLWSGRTEQARALLREASRRHPDDPDVRRALASLGEKGVPLNSSRSSVTASSNKHSDAESIGESQPSTAKGKKGRNGRSFLPIYLSWFKLSEHQLLAGIALALIGFLYLSLHARRAAKSRVRESQRFADHLSFGAKSARVSGNRSTAASRQSASADAGRVISSIPHSSKASSAAFVSTSSVAMAIQTENTLSTGAVDDEPLMCELETPDVPVQHMDQLSPQSKDSATEPGRMPILLASVPPVSRLEPELQRHFPRRLLIIGGSAGLVELERRWLVGTRASVKFLSEWIPAIALALSTPPDIIVLNPTTEDGWSSLRMYKWITANQSSLAPLCLVVVSTNRGLDPESDWAPEAQYLFEPFSGSEWLEAIGKMNSCVANQPSC